MILMDGVDASRFLRDVEKGVKGVYKEITVLLNKLLDQNLDDAERAQWSASLQNAEKRLHTLRALAEEVRQGYYKTKNPNQF